MFKMYVGYMITISIIIKTVMTFQETFFIVFLENSHLMIIIKSDNLLGKMFNLKISLINHGKLLR